MLKACCDCIAGGIREQNDAYGAETIQLNGRSPRTPSWPEANGDKQKMFILPRILNLNDEINITGVFSRNSSWISLSLLTGRDVPSGIEPDYNNTACQLYISLDSNDGKGSIVLKIIKDGKTMQEDLLPYAVDDLIPELYGNGSELRIDLKLTESTDNNEYEVNFYSTSFIGKITLKHNYQDIRYLVLDGAVDKVRQLGFIFG